jgi:hypothetical protein
MNILCNTLTSFGLSLCEPAVSAELHQAFIEHVASYGLNFGTQEEYNFRLSLFVQKDAEIQKINSSQDSFVVGHNLFSTMTKNEINRMLGDKPLMNLPAPEYQTFDVSNLTDSIDWREMGAVNPVKNQGMCGSCWSFSATSTIESRYFIKTGYLLNLSEQEFVDCDPNSLGCNGGMAASAYQYAIENGMEEGADYPYTAKDGKCSYDRSKVHVEVTAFAWVTPKSVDQLKAAIEQGPTSVSVQAD